MQYEIQNSVNIIHVHENDNSWHFIDHKHIQKQSLSVHVHEKIKGKFVLKIVHVYNHACVHVPFELSQHNKLSNWRPENIICHLFLKSP